jgi:hypothetical protein
MTKAAFIVFITPDAVRLRRRETISMANAVSNLGINTAEGFPHADCDPVRLFYSIHSSCSFQVLLKTRKGTTA